MTYKHTSGFVHKSRDSPSMFLTVRNRISGTLSPTFETSVYTLICDQAWNTFDEGKKV